MPLVRADLARPAQQRVVVAMTAARARGRITRTLEVLEVNASARLFSARSP